jgi:hypothetical protein
MCPTDIPKMARHSHYGDTNANVPSALPNFQTCIISGNPNSPVRQVHLLVHLTDGKSEAQRDKVTCSKSHSLSVKDKGLSPGTLTAIAQLDPCNVSPSTSLPVTGWPVSTASFLKRTNRELITFH